MTLLARWIRWLTCPHCKQDMTGVYAGKPLCIRCSNRSWLTADHPIAK